MKTKDRVVLAFLFSFVAVLIVFALSIRGTGSRATTDPSGAPEAPPSSNGAISPQDQADALHFVIAADREMYCQQYIAHQKEGDPLPNLSTSNKSSDSWPLPAEMFRRAAESIQSKGAEFSYALRSLRPIDPRNGPQTELEQRGLAAVASHPAQNYYGQEMLGGRRYFTAVYPDLHAVAACVDCHNRSSTSIPQRLQVGDILGGIVVRVPLEF
jgi:hypothetical protein